MKSRDLSSPALTDSATRSSTTNTWQPSASDFSSPTYQGHQAADGFDRVGLATNRTSWGVWVGATAAALLLLGLSWRVLVPAQQVPTLRDSPTAQVELLRGDVFWVDASNSRRPLAVGQTLAAGTIFESGSRSEVEPGLALRLGNGASLRLAAESKLQLISEHEILLDRGALYLDTGGENVEVRTAFGTVRDLGTRFEVRLGGTTSLRVRVRQGEVELTPLRGAVSRAGAGFELLLNTGGGAASRKIVLSGDEWKWVERLAVPPPGRFRSLAEVLAWAAAEKGLELRYSNAASLAHAQATRVHGVIQGPEPISAAFSLLEGSGLAMKTGDDELLVSMVVGQ